MSNRDDPVLRHSRREAIWILVAWAAATVFCCVYTYCYGYIRDDHPLTKADVHATFGIPSWFFWGVIVPWGACAIFTFWFAGFFMADDDLGVDHVKELDDELRGGGVDA